MCPSIPQKLHFKFTRDDRGTEWLRAFSLGTAVSWDRFADDSCAGRYSGVGRLGACTVRVMACERPDASRNRVSVSAAHC